MWFELQSPPMLKFCFYGLPATAGFPAGRIPTWGRHRAFESALLSFARMPLAGSPPLRRTNAGVRAAKDQSLALFLECAPLQQPGFTVSNHLPLGILCYQQPAWIHL